MRWVVLLLLLLGVNFAPAAGAAELQFDVFLGYDGVVSEAAWAPIVCEIKNDNPTIQGVVEVSSVMGGPVTRLEVELPPGTLKRVTIPVFCPIGGYASWNVRLLSRKGAVLAEHQGVQARHFASRRVPVLGALSRTPVGTPQIVQIENQNNRQMQPESARLLPQLFPDNYFALDGLSALYLNSERATDLKPGQVAALLAWLRHGGHLIVALEQPQDLESSPWLRDIVPFRPKTVQPLTGHTALQDWLRGPWPLDRINSTQGHQLPQRKPGKNRSMDLPAPDEAQPFSDLTSDNTFEAAELRIMTGEVRNGRIVVSAGEIPLILSAESGLGKVSVLLFSPEREPMRSWANLPVFWARLLEVPGRWYLSPDYHQNTGWSADNVIGAMLETQQAQKLPIGALLLLLLGYIIVIGPVDYLLVRRLGQPMLTWITFPLYVAGFSLVIYMIGFKLRAGDLEWNELQVVDVVEPGNREAVLRGRTYGSLYSPVSHRYGFSAPATNAVFRGEHGGWFRGSGQSDLFISLTGDSFKASAEVPVWTSQLFSSEWLARGRAPVSLRLSGPPEGLQLACDNRIEANLYLSCIVSNRIVSVGELPKGANRTFHLDVENGTAIHLAQSAHWPRIQSAVHQRQYAFGRGKHAERLEDWMFITSLLSVAQEDVPPQGGQISSDPDLDLSAATERPDHAIVFVSAETPVPGVKPMTDFKPKRGKRLTVWRIVLPIEKANSSS